MLKIKRGGRREFPPRYLFKKDENLPLYRENFIFSNLNRFKKADSEYPKENFIQHLKNLDKDLTDKTSAEFLHSILRGS